MRFRLKRITFLGRNFDLTGVERIHFTLYWNQQIDTGLLYMEGDDDAVPRFRARGFFQPYCLQASGLVLAREKHCLHMRRDIDVRA